MREFESLSNLEKALTLSLSPDGTPVRLPEDLLALSLTGKVNRQQIVQYLQRK